MLKTHKRSRMGNLLLRMLMTICELGKEWKDPSKIPVKEIVEEWRNQSTRGRYNDSAIWSASALAGRRSNSNSEEPEFDEEERLQNLRNHPEWQRM